jgi:hypothetical protein
LEVIDNGRNAVHDIAIILVHVIYFFHCPDANTRRTFIVFTGIWAVKGRRGSTPSPIKRCGSEPEEYGMQKQKKLKVLEY